MHKNKTQYKKIVSFRLIVLLCIAFLFQQVPFATIQNTIGFTSQNCRSTQNNYFEKGSTEHQELQLNLFLEAESEDEDDVHNKESDCNEFISGSRNSKIYRYTEAINKLSLKLVSTNQRKVDLPFFILYHSWKSHLA
jgi:hypothetical protein